MKRPFSYIRILVLAAVMAVSAFVASPALYAAGKAPVWETVRVYERGGDMPVESDDGTRAAFEVEVRDGMVYVSTDVPVKVEVFTILGQLVTSHTVSPGTVRLRMGNRGIYILKGAGTTRRVNL